MISVQTTAQALANYYVTLGNWIGITTGNPGGTSTPANEAHGGLPAYARVETTWEPQPANGTYGLQSGSEVLLHAGFGSYTYAILCSGSTGDNMIDSCQVLTTEVLLQATLVVVPEFVQQ